MHYYTTQKNINYFYRVFRANKISEPYTSLKFLLFKSKFFINQTNTDKNKNKLIAINHNRLKIFPNFNKSLKKQNVKLNKRQTRFFIEDCLKRLKHTPIQYILRQWYFRNKIFYVDYNILIPRIETEKIIDIVFEQMQLLFNQLNVEKSLNNDEKREFELNFIEIGVGSGVIFISVLKEYQAYFKKFLQKQKKNQIESLNIKCIGIDINEKSCLVAQVNSALMGLSEKEFEVQNISFEQYLEKNHNQEVENSKKFDFLISNPPYIKEEYKKTMQKDVVLHEDHRALFSGEDGLSLIRNIVENSRKLVKKNGFVLLEIDENQTNGLVKLLVLNKFQKFFTENDIFGKTRFFIYYVN